MESCQCIRGCLLSVGRCAPPTSVVVSSMIPTISQRRTSGRVTSARRHLSASLIPGRLCVLVLTANIETSEQSPELPQGESRDVQSKEWLIMLPLMVAAVMSPATARSYQHLINMERTGHARLVSTKCIIKDGCRACYGLQHVTCTVMGGMPFMTYGGHHFDFNMGRCVKS